MKNDVVRRLGRLAAFAAVLALAACANFEPRAPMDAKVEPASLGATAGTSVEWPRDDWWKRYGDSQLDVLVDEGLAGSPSLAAARARIAKAMAAAGLARSALLPEVSGNAALTYQRYSENYIFPPPLGGTWVWDNRGTFDFSFEFDFWDKNGAALRSALSQVQGAAADSETARITLTAAIARAHFNLQRLFAQRDVSLAALTQRDDIVRITSQRFGAGLDTKVEVRQADAALATVRTELAQYDDAIAIARNQLAALVGAGPERGKAIEQVKLNALASPALPASIPLDLVARRPEIVASRWRIDAAKEDINVAKAQFYPNVNIAAFVGLSALGFPHLVTSGSTIFGVGPAVHLPIFEGGRLNANLHGKDADANLAVASYNQTVIDAVHDVADAMQSIRDHGRIASEQAKAREATTDAYNVAVIRYRAGLGNYLSVLTAQTAQLAQDRLEADLAYRAFDLDVNLVRALGGGYIDVSAPKLANATH
jgi:NodT family efflux transporter outer membrane factor (OMF) lipoprotein